MCTARRRLLDIAAAVTEPLFRCQGLRDRTARETAGVRRTQGARQHPSRHFISPGSLGGRPAARSARSARGRTGDGAARPVGRALGQPYQAAARRDCAGPAERGDERVARLAGAGEPGDVVVECRCPCPRAVLAPVRCGRARASRPTAARRAAAAGLVRGAGSPIRPPAAGAGRGRRARRGRRHGGPGGTIRSGRCGGARRRGRPRPGASPGSGSTTAVLAGAGPGTPRRRPRRGPPRS